MTFHGKTLLIAVACVQLSACAYFEPTYPEPVVQSFSAGYEDVSELVAAADLGSMEEPVSYAEYRKTYEEALGRLEAARTWVKRQAESDRDIPATEAARLMLAQMNGCVENARAMARMHQEQGVVAGSGISNVRTSCAIPLNNLVQ